MSDLVQSYGPTLFKGLAVAGVSGVVISRFMTSTANAEAPGDKTAGKKIFGRAGPVFTRLALESSEDVNHNTKRLSFKLPGNGDVSGLPLTCEFDSRFTGILLRKEEVPEPGTDVTFQRRSSQYLGPKAIPCQS